MKEFLNAFEEWIDFLCQRALLIIAIRHLQMGRWELPEINIGGQADYTPYCLN